MKSTPVPWRACSSATSLRICAWVVTSSAVVGSSAMRSRGPSTSAIAIMIRWRWPPESWCGYEATIRAGSGRCTSRTMSRIFARRAAASSVVCSTRTSSICSPQRMTGLSAVIGSWKIIDIRVARSWRSRPVAARVRSSPSSRIAPPVTGSVFGSRPITLCAITDLPEPDSPTRQRISPRPTSNDARDTASARSAPGGSAIVRSRTSSTAALIAAAPCAGRACRAARRRRCLPRAPSPRGRCRGRTRCADRR